jgi:hypothetical protein
VQVSGFVPFNGYFVLYQAFPMQRVSPRPWVPHATLVLLRLADVFPSPEYCASAQPNNAVWLVPADRNSQPFWPRRRTQESGRLRPVQYVADDLDHPKPPSIRPEAALNGYLKMV